MKTKKLTIGVLVASLLVSLCLLCFGSYSLIVKAEDTTSSTVDSVVDEEISSDTAEKPEDSFNNQVKAWLSTVFGAGGIAFDILLIVLTSRKKNEPVTVTVNDAETQKKLETIANENNQLHALVVDMFQLQKGTFEILKTIFADNTGLEEKVRDTIKQIALHEEDIVKDFQDILSSENHKKVKTTLKNISNIILG